MSSFWRRRPFSNQEEPSTPEAEERGPDSRSDLSELAVGDTHYIAGKASNNAQTFYQDASGAPVEENSPLGYAVGPITIIFLNISKMIGTGIFSTPSTILVGTGSIGLSLILWASGSVLSISSFAIYLEFTAYFPSRSGAEVVYLEQAFPRPRWLFSTAFAFQSVILSFSSASSFVLAQYLFKMSSHTATNWELKGAAVAGYTVAIIFVALNNRFAYYIANGIGFAKLATLIFISVTGLVVLGGHTKVEDPTANFHNSFEGKVTAYGITNALYKVVFSYTGFENAFNVVNEVKNPVKQIRRHGSIALFTVTILYNLVVVAYYSAVSKVNIMHSKQTVATLFFSSVFGSSKAIRGLNILIALSAFGNLMAGMLGTSRIIRECGRQGVLPWTKFWVSTWPFGTTLGPYLSMYFITLIMILAPPAGDAFNFVGDLRIYPASFFDFLMAVGLLFVRRRRKALNLPRPEFKAWDVVIWFNILKDFYLIVMPWYPPSGGANGGDVSFWYGTYIVTSVGIILACVVYYGIWIYGIPYIRKYKIREQVVTLSDGSKGHQLVKVPMADLEDWDRTHDHTGRLISDGGSTPDEKPHTSDGGIVIKSKGIWPDKDSGDRVPVNV